MEDFSKYLGVNRRLAVICCITCVFVQADGNNISYAAGSTVTLHCNKTSINCLIQLAWKKDGVNLFSFLSQRNSNSSCNTSNNSQKTSDSKLQKSPLAASLELNMSTLESELYALTIESAKETHTGNYTCETITDAGVFEQKWELIITEPVEAALSNKRYVAVVTVPCLCLLIVVITASIILRGVCKKRSQSTTQPPRTLHQQKEPVYENLEIEAHQRSVKIQVHPYKYRAE